MKTEYKTTGRNRIVCFDLSSPLLGTEKSEKISLWFQRELYIYAWAFYEYSSPVHRNGIKIKQSIPQKTHSGKLKLNFLYSFRLLCKRYASESLIFYFKHKEKNNFGEDHEFINKKPNRNFCFLISVTWYSV